MFVFFNRLRFLVTCLLFLPLFVLASGCGSNGTVTGKVYFKGKLVTRGTVGFYPEGQGGNYPSLIESDGSYEISKVPPGRAKISVVIGRKGPPPNLFSKMRGGGGAIAAKGMQKQQAIAKAVKSEEAESADPKEDLASWPEKYANPEKSGLTFEVKGGKQNFDIKLE